MIAKSFTIKINNREYTLEENKWYRLEFKPGYEIGTSPFLVCKALQLLFEDMGNSFFLVLDEKEDDDHLICDDELLSVTEIEQK
jgi:hypothetical protein